MITSETSKKLHLGQLLVQSGVITDEQLEQALDYQRQKGNTLLLGEVLQKRGLCSEEDIMRALASAYGVPFARVSPKIADPKVIELLPREFLNRHAVLPLFKVRDRLTLAVNEPANVFLLEEVGRLTQCEVLVVCATAKEIAATLDNHLPSANIFVIDDAFGEEDAGELSLIDGEPRFASALAATYVTLLVLSKDKFVRLTKESPYLGVTLALKLAKLMSQRLRRTTGRLIDIL